MNDMGEAEENYKGEKNTDNKKCKLECCPVFCLNLRMRCPNKCKCRCLKMNKVERIHANHYRQLEREVHIGYILSTLRALKMIVREKFTAKEWRRAFDKHSKLGYPSDDSIENNITDSAIVPLQTSRGGS